MDFRRGVFQIRKLVAEKLKALGVQEKDIQSKEDFGSSDLGNVAHAYPTVNVVFKIAQLFFICGGVKLEPKAGCL